MKTLSCLALLLFALAACQKAPPPPPTPTEPDPKTGGRHAYQEVTYFFPQEDQSSYSDDAAGEFRYESPGLKIIVAQGVIWINGRKHGKTQKGDQVNFMAKGHVFVNGKLRQPEL
jgi:hypothetical protein